MMKLKALKELFDALVKRIEGKGKEIAKLERAAYDRGYDRGKAAASAHTRYFSPAYSGGCTAPLAAA